MPTRWIEAENARLAPARVTPRPSPAEPGALEPDVEPDVEPDPLTWTWRRGAVALQLDWFDGGGHGPSFAVWRVGRAVLAIVEAGP